MSFQLLRSGFKLKLLGERNEPGLKPHVCFLGMPLSGNNFALRQVLKNFWVTVGEFPYKTNASGQKAAKGKNFSGTILDCDFRECRGWGDVKARASMARNTLTAGMGVVTWTGKGFAPCRIDWSRDMFSQRC